MSKTDGRSNCTESNESAELFILIACILDNFMLETDCTTSQGEGGSSTATGGYFHFYTGKHKNLGQIIIFATNPVF